ncbi:MAG: hypothetical protein ACH344_02600 [Yersinia sp. (in: enterobacteria)]|jgi:hypothetical protein
MTPRHDKALLRYHDLPEDIALQHLIDSASRKTEQTPPPWATSEKWKAKHLNLILVN